MKNIVKKNYKILIGIVIGIIISTTIVYSAENILTGSDVTYSNGSSSSDNVQKAIDELYKKADSCNNSNINIVKAYVYNQNKADDYCITGDESTCKLSNCYKIKKTNSCPPGTIIDYLVSNREMIRFHVVHDDGEKITIQTQKNTVYNTAWYTEKDNSEGPITILTALEDKTNNWTNVNTLSYSIGDDKSTLGYSGCNSILYCNEKIYELSKSDVKARMITMQEAYTLGCRNGIKTCPIWMYNYLENSTSNDGTVNDTHTENNATGNFGYWTMDAYSDNHPTASRFVKETGTTNDWTLCNEIHSGARAVVEINK